MHLCIFMNICVCVSIHTHVHTHSHTHTLTHSLIHSHTPFHLFQDMFPPSSASHDMSQSRSDDDYSLHRGGKGGSRGEGEYRRGRGHDREQEARSVDASIRGVGLQLKNN